MSNYYENKNKRRKRRSRKEKIGFYTAFSICLVAVCMAVYSTYNTVSSPKGTLNPTASTQSAMVNQFVTGVTEATTMPENIFVTLPTEVAEDNTSSESSGATHSTDDALQTMLSADITLTYPVENPTVVRGYTKESTYFKTLNVWKPHTGVDFEAELGDVVYAMCDGEVTKVFDDKMYGKSLDVSFNNVVITYSGFAEVNFDKGDSVKVGEKLGTVGAVPFEASDETHIHISMRVDGKYVDPLNYIGNEE